jgi:hypothetical protein
LEIWWSQMELTGDALAEPVLPENSRKKGGKTQLPVADGRTEWNPLRSHVTDVTTGHVTSDSTNTSQPSSNANWAVLIYFSRHLVNNGAMHIYVHDYRLRRGFHSVRPSATGSWVFPPFFREFSGKLCSIPRPCSIGELKSEKVWEIWKKSKLNSEKIWKNMEETHVE